MHLAQNVAPANAGTPPWEGTVKKYAHPDAWRSLWQVTNTLIPYFGMWYLMYRSLDMSYWLTLALAFPTAGLLIRIFIIFHDCGHGAFFASKHLSDLVGTVCGILTFAPYFQWRHDHAVHHATAGDLDRRGIGDVWTMTVREYLDATRWTRLCYRVVRNPLVMFGIVPIFLFLVRQRFSRWTAAPRERHSVYAANVAIAGMLAIMCLTVGFKAYVLVQLPLLLISSGVGVWLFYVQHQFEDVCWDRGDEWDFVAVALQGSSFYKLPKVLQWFTGNIGYHHIHHLRPRIPNYYLQRCHEEDPTFRATPPLTLLASLRSLSLHLWDEERRALVGFRHLRTLRAA